MEFLSLKSIRKLALLGLVFASESKAESYGKVGEHYLRSFSQLEGMEERSEQILPSSQLTLASEHECRALAFKILDEAPAVSEKKETPLITSQVWRDLDLLFNEGPQTQNHFLSKINYTQTKMGEAVLAERLAFPHLNDSTFTKKLVDDERLFGAIESELERARGNEVYFLSLFKELDPAAKALIDKVYFSNRFLKNLNKNPYALEVASRVEQLRLPFWSSYPLLIYMAMKLGIALSYNTFGDFDHQQAMLRYEFLKKKYPNTTFSEPEPFTKKSYSGEALQALKDVKNLITNAPATFRKFKEDYYDSEKNFKIDLERFMEEHKDSPEYAENTKKIATYARRIGQGFSVVGGIGYGGYILYNLYIKIKDAYSQNKEYLQIQKSLQTQLIGIANYIKSLKEIKTIVENDREVHACFSSLQSARNVLDSSLNSAYSKVQEALSLLSSSTFEGKASFFSFMGRVLATYQILNEVKADIVPAVQLLGEVDAYYSIAHLFKKHQSQKIDYCFVTFVNNAQPYIKLDNFWNPFVDANVVVANSIELGAASAQNAIITGPNGGGKSTVLSAIALSLIMAHSFGIAPASQAVMTPFALINTYLNIIDDKASGKSLFQMQAQRAEELMFSIASLPADKFVFTIIDELFSGTNHVEGEAAAYSVTKSITSCKNSIFMIATHFSRLTTLEEKDRTRCANYKVSVTKDEHGKLSYPYLLEHGITEQYIALDILKEKGFSSSILDEAHSIVNNVRGSEQTSAAA